MQLLNSVSRCPRLTPSAMKPEGAPGSGRRSTVTSARPSGSLNPPLFAAFAASAIASSGDAAWTTT